MTTDLTHRWNGTARAYAQSFALTCAGAVGPLLDAVGPVTGRTLLDVGTGTGAVAAEAVHRGASVVAADPDPDMRAFAAAHLDVPVRDAAVPGTDLPDAEHEVVVANFVVNHLPDPHAGVRELARLARDMVGVTIWPGTPGLQARLLAQTVERAGASIPPGQRLPADLDFPRTPEGLAGLLRGAGLRDVVAAPVDWRFRIAPDTLWSGVEAGIGVVGRTWLTQDDHVREAMGAAWREVTAPYVVDGLAVLPTTALLATGRVGA